MQQGLSDLKTEEIKRGAKRKKYGTGLERTLKSNKPSHLERKPNKRQARKIWKRRWADLSMQPKKVTSADKHVSRPSRPEKVKVREDIKPVPSGPWKETTEGVKRGKIGNRWLTDLVTLKRSYHRGCQGGKTHAKLVWLITNKPRTGVRDQGNQIQQKYCRVAEKGRKRAQEITPYQFQISYFQSWFMLNKSTLSSVNIIFSAMHLSKC